MDSGGLWKVVEDEEGMEDEGCGIIERKVEGKRFRMVFCLVRWDGEVWVREKISWIFLFVYILYKNNFGKVKCNKLFIICKMWYI